MGIDVNRERAIDLAVEPDREAVRQGRHHEARGGRRRRRHPCAADGLARARHRARHRRHAARPGRRDLRAGVVGQDHAGAPAHRRGAEARRHLRLHRRRARARRRLRAEARRATPKTCSISQPDNGEQALEIADTLVRSGAIDVLVIDSVAALVPRAEIEGEMGDPHMGLQARLMSQALRKLTGTISKSRTIVIFINQIRMKIGVMFGNPETTTGGNALKFYASVRLDIRRIGAHQARRGGDRQPHQGEGGEEQGGAAVPRGRVRHPLRHRASRKEGELIDLGAGARHHREVRRLVRVRGRAHRPGPRERARLPAASTPRPRPRSRRKVREKFGLKADVVRLPARRRTGNGSAEGGRAAEVARQGEGRKGLERRGPRCDPSRGSQSAGIRHSSEVRRPPDLSRERHICCRWEDYPGARPRAMASLTQELLERVPSGAARRSSSRSTLGYGHPEFGRFRVNVFYQRGELQAALRSHPAARAAHPRAQPAARHRAHRAGAPRPDPRHRHHGQRQVDDARRDDRPDQPHRRPATSSPSRTRSSTCTATSSRSSPSARSASTA